MPHSMHPFPFAPSSQGQGYCPHPPSIIHKPNYPTQPRCSSPCTYSSSASTSTTPIHWPTTIVYHFTPLPNLSQPPLPWPSSQSYSAEVDGPDAVLPQGCSTQSCHCFSSNLGLDPGVEPVREKQGALGAAVQKRKQIKEQRKAA